ncbi:MAG TPA: HD domain-containing protein [Chloroflexota bacterium]|nr:HD domain-containing protein [Chloroflexota bacterium]
MTQIARHPKLQDLARSFDEAGHRLYLVGGTVRDRLLGRPDVDIDLTTDAVPTTIKALIGKHGPTTIYTVGEEFGTIGVLFDDLKLEVTTFRSEIYRKRSRRPDVQFGTSLRDDLARRDYTINAIAEDVLSGDLIDPFDGLGDLERRLIRAVGEPAERFDEDPLRMLRGVRLAVQTGFTIEPPTRVAIAVAAESITTISRERISDELNKILLSPRPARGIRTLADLNLLAWIIPSVLELRVVNQGLRTKDVFEHTMIVLDRTPADLPTRWAALLHDIAKPRTMVVENGEASFPGHERVGEQMARDILIGLRIDSRTAASVARLVGMHMRANHFDESWTDGAVRRLIRDASDDLERVFSLAAADVSSARPARIEAAEQRVRQLRYRSERLQAEENVQSLASPLDGNELMQLFGRKPGPWIREVKAYLLALVIDGEILPDDRQEAIRRAAALLGTEPAVPPIATPDSK